MKKWVSFIGLSLVLVLGACGNDEKEPEVNEENTGSTEESTEETILPEEDSEENESTNEEEIAPVTVDLIDVNGDSIGSAELKEEDNGVLVQVSASGLPAGSHGFHFHETGKCELPDFESAGGHFNPTGASHGLDHEDGPHAGDLPNLQVGEDGSVEEGFLAEHVTLKKGEDNSLLQENGTALVIHADEDDGETQPSGNSGDRIACGVVE